MKFPLKVEIIKEHAPSPKIGVISIAAVNSVVKKGRVPTYISVRVQGDSYANMSSISYYRDSVAFSDLYYEGGSKPLAEDLKAEIQRRIAVKKDSTIDLGQKSLKPTICLRVTLQVKTKKGLPTEDPDAEPHFRARLKYWDGKNHHLWADYDPVTDDLVVKIKGKRTKVVFTNHDDVLAAIRELMPS